MGTKEKLQKELDLLLEKIRFWRYAIFAIVSGVVGVLFGLTQNEVKNRYIGFKKNSYKKLKFFPLSLDSVYIYSCNMYSVGGRKVRNFGVLIF